MRPAEGQKFLGQNPIEVTVFDELIVLVFVRIEIVKIKETGLVGFVDGTQAIVQRNFVRRLTVRSIAISCVWWNVATY